MVLAVSGCDESGGKARPPEMLFGKTGLGLGEFSYPRAAAVVPGGPLFIVDKAGRIQVFEQDGTPLRQWRMPEFSAGKPTGLGVDPINKKLYAADTHYSRVMIFDFDGNLLGAFGESGEGPGQFRLPTDVEIDRTGRIYVAEYGGNDRISVFSPEHEFLFSFDGTRPALPSSDLPSSALRLSRPQSIRIGPDDTLWAADACNHRICRFDLSGRLLAAFGRLGDGPGNLRFPYGVDVLRDGTLVVVEYGNNRVQRFDASGKSLGTWGRPGRSPGELAYPWAGVAGDDGRVFVIDSGNNRVQVYGG